MSIMFDGGPLSGQSAPDPNAPAGEAPAESESELFRRVLADVRALLAGDSLSEQNRLNVSRAETLLQQVKASEEKEENDAMSGKLSPGVLRKLGGGA